MCAYTYTSIHTDASACPHISARISAHVHAHAHAYANAHAHMRTRMAHAPASPYVCPSGAFLLSTQHNAQQPPHRADTHTAKGTHTPRNTLRTMQGHTRENTARGLHRNETSHAQHTTIIWTQPCKPQKGTQINDHK